MIKKHLIACSGILFLLLIAKLSLNKNSRNSINSFPQKVDFPSEEKEEDSQPSSAHVSSKKYHFANEIVPIQDEKVAWRIHKQLKAYSYKNLRTNKLHRKAEKWFPVIEPILKLHGIPEDFKYMPLVESGFKEGTSPKGAAGYWQFMPGTARTYGLKVNSQIDERNNMRKSTVAACKYLNSLFSEFKDWTLVAAAYNMGENGLWREVRRQGKRNYYKMKLNRETASYVYKLVSVKQIIENPMRYGYVQRKHTLLAKKQMEPAKADTFLSVIPEQDSMAGISIFYN